MTRNEEFSAADSILCCPYCRSPLERLPPTYRCPLGHSFDIARQGYVNLLPPARRHSRDPGDNREMILARQRFLGCGFFDRIADHVNASVLDALAPGALAGNILDAGSGEGFYLARLQAALLGRPAGGSSTFYGVDISRHGAQYATHRSKTVTWLVASIVDLPVQTASCDVLLSIFAPLAAPEFQRVLRPGGTLVVVGPGPAHLQSLRQLLYPTVVPHAREPLPHALAYQFSPTAESRLTYDVVLPSAQTIADVLTMTPFGWNVTAEQRLRAEGAAPLVTTVDVALSVFARTGEEGAATKGDAASRDASSEQTC